MLLSLLDRRRDTALLLLRLAIAAIFLYHGLPKWGLWGAPVPGMSDAMLTIIRVLSVVEPLSALLLIFGFMTRGAALALAIVMIGAHAVKIASSGWDLGIYELDLILLTANIVLLTFGAGRFSADRGKR